MAPNLSENLGELNTANYYVYDVDTTQLTWSSVPGAVAYKIYGRTATSGVATGTVYCTGGTSVTYSPTDSASFGREINISLKKLIDIRTHWLLEFRDTVPEIIPQQIKFATKLRRAHARSCRKDVAKHKRRRFVQKLSK